MLAQNQTDPIILSIERTQRSIYVLCALTILILLSCGTYGCLFLNFCHTSSDINIPPYTSHSFLPILLVILILCFLSYHSAKYIHINYLGPLRFLLLIFFILLTCLIVAEFIAGLSLAYTNRDSIWGKLPPLAQSYYSNNEDNMNQEYTINIIYVFVVEVVCVVFMLVVMILVWILYSKTPTGYLPRLQIEKKVGRPRTGSEEMLREGFERSEQQFAQSDLGRPAFDRSREMNEPGDQERDESWERNNPLRPRGEEGMSGLQEIREGDDEHPFTQSRNPFLRGTK